jgi:hypothetical protein
MNKFVIAALATTLALPVSAQTGSIVLGPPQFAEGGYANRGACESALAQERNRQRQDPAARGAGYQDLSRAEFNRASRMTTRCELRDGRWQVVFNQNGF